MFVKSFFIALTLIFNCAVIHAAEVELKINGLKKDGGFIMMGISKTADEFAEKSPYFKGMKITATEPITVTIFHLPEGSYALSLYHDENQNGKFDTGAFGRPKEGYGFSNNIFGSMGRKPTFEQALINIEENSKNIIDIHIR